MKYRIPSTSHSTQSNAGIHDPMNITQYTVSVLGREEGYAVKYTPLPEGVPEGEVKGYI